MFDYYYELAGGNVTVFAETDAFVLMNPDVIGKGTCEEDIGLYLGREQEHVVSNGQLMQKTGAKIALEAKERKKNAKRLEMKDGFDSGHAQIKAPYPRDEIAGWGAKSAAAHAWLSATPEDRTAAIDAINSMPDESDGTIDALPPLCRLCSIIIYEADAAAVSEVDGLATSVLRNAYGYGKHHGTLVNRRKELSATIDASDDPESVDVSYGH